MSSRGKPAHSMTLFERGAEQDLIGRALHADVRGRGTALIVEAPAGLGKTSLLDVAATRAAEAGLDTHRASGDVGEQELPWSVVLQLLHALPDAPDLAGDLLQEPDSASTGNPLALLDRVYRLVCERAEHHRMLLLVDDLHWADEQSLQCLRYLVRRIDRLNVSLIATTRPAPVRPEVAEPIEALLRATSVDHVALKPLSDEAMTELVHRVAPGARPGTVEAVVRSVAGNPLLGHEVATLVATHRVPSGEPIPDLTDGPRLDAWIKARLRETGPSAVQIAQAIAVLGRRTGPDSVSRVADVPIPEVVDCIDQLVSAQLLDPEPLDFRHPVVREVVLSSTGPARRLELHYRCAELLNSRSLPREVAQHLLASVPRGQEWEIEALHESAGLDFAAGAPDRAARCLRLVLELVGADRRDGLLIELGRAELAAGEIAAAGRFREALASRTEPAPALDLQIGEWLYAGGAFDDAMHAFEKGLTDADGHDDPVLEARLLAGLDTAALLCGSHPEAAARRVAAIAADPPDNPTHADLILMVMAAGEAALGIDRPCAQISRLVEVVLAAAPPDSFGRALLEPVVGALAYCDEFKRGRVLLGELLDAATARGELVASISLRALGAFCHLRLGDLGSAEDEAREVLALAETHPSASKQALAPAYYVLAQVHLERGDLTAAEQALDIDAEALWGAGLMRGWYFDAQGRLALARGDGAAAYDAFTKAGQRFTAAGGDGAWCEWRGGLALSARALGDHAAAHRWADQAVQVATRFGPASRIASALRVSAVVAEDPAEQERLLRRALDELSGSDATLDRAHTLVALGGVMRRTGRRRDCRDVLRQGREVARSCSAWALTHYATEELESSGARRTTQPLTGLDALTGAELRVVELAVSGRSNREIAETLFVSRKTVESHLSNSYRKLGVTGRTELAERFAEPHGEHSG